jgi:hypothetical protein
MERLGRPVQEFGVDASLSSTDDDVVDPFNFKEHDLWWKSELYSGCRQWNRRWRRGCGVGRCAWEAVYSTDLPRSKLSSAASILWCLILASGDDSEAVSVAVTNGTLHASRKMNRCFKLL